MGEVQAGRANFADIHSPGPLQIARLATREEIQSRSLIQGRGWMWYKRFRHDIPGNWPCASRSYANWLGARHWPLEPGCTGVEFDYRERHFWVAGHGGWASRQTQRGGRVDCRGCDGRDYGLLCRGGLAVFPGGRTLSVRARGVRAPDWNSGWLDALPGADSCSGSEC